MDIGVTKMSSKGQIIIPAEMRQDIKEGDKMIVIRNKDQIIMKKMDKMKKSLEEDLEFAKRTEAAWQRYQQGKFKTMKASEFLEMIKKC